MTRRAGLIAAALLTGGAPAALMAQQATPAAPPSSSSGTAAPASPAAAQATDPAGADEDDTANDVVVRGTRTQPGAVIGDIPPEQQLGQAEIRSYGVSTVSDLLDELAPQTRSDRGSGGAPVVLLNGRRVAGFSEIRDLPTEAIQRVDILPEEVALKYGYAADQKVVNFVLRPRFRSLALEASDSQATDGGRNTPRGDATLTNIKGDDRFNLDLNYTEAPALLESQRDLVSTATSGNYALAGNIVPGIASTDGVIDPALVLAGQPVAIAGVGAGAATGTPTLSSFVPGTANTTDLRPYRSLLSATQTFSGNAVLSKALSPSLTATINGRVQYDATTADQGLPAVALTVPAGNPYSPFARDVVLDRYIDQGLPLQQQSQTLATHLGASVNHQGVAWRWSVTANYDRSEAKTFTDVGVDASGAQAALDAGSTAFNPFGPLAAPYVVPGEANRARSVSNVYGIDGLLTGPLFRLPAGRVNTSWKLGFTGNDLDSSSYRFGTIAGADLSRTVENGQLNVDIPLTSRREGFLSGVGNLSANVNYALNHLSDFGTLHTLGYGANWSPIDAIRVLVSVTDQDIAPSQAQLGNPVITTPNVRVFDYVNGTTVDVTQISGGNPALAASNRHVFKAELNLKPLKGKDLSITANYISTHTDRPIESLPGATAAVEAAFPDRFVRDGDGDLVSVDARPVNFRRADTSELRYGFNLSLPLKSRIQKEIERFRAGEGPNPFQNGAFQKLRQLRNAPSVFGGTVADSNRPARPDGAGGPDRPRPAAGDASTNPSTPAATTTTTTTPATGTTQTTAGGASGGAQPTATDGGRTGGGGYRGGGFGGRGGGFGGRGGGGGRVQFALFHTWHFTDRLSVRDGVPDIDLLNGGSIGSAGQPRHELEGQAGYSNNGLGARISADWQSATRVNGGTLADPDTLRFSGLSTINLRLFFDPTQRPAFLAHHPWALGTRMTLGVTNLFNARQRVTDDTGATPISYQPDYLNPLGRTVRISIRKLLF